MRRLCGVPPIRRVIRWLLSHGAVLRLWACVLVAIMLLVRVHLVPVRARNILFESALIIILPVRRSVPPLVLVVDARHLQLNHLGSPADRGTELVVSIGRRAVLNLLFVFGQYLNGLKLLLVIPVLIHGHVSV